MSRTIKIGNVYNLKVNLSAYDRYGVGIVFASIFGYTYKIKEAEKELKKKCDITFYSTRFSHSANAFDVYTSKVPNSDVSHMIISRKDTCEGSSGYETLRLSIIHDYKNGQEIPYVNFDDVNAVIPPEIVEAAYDKLYKYCPAPIIRDWVPHILRKLYADRCITELITYSLEQNKHNLMGWLINCDVRAIIDIISEGLKNGDITINGSMEVSDEMENVKGIDQYLNLFGPVFADKIKDTFRPRFVPREDDYSTILKDVADYAEYHGHLRLFDAQKAVAQGTANALNHKDSSFIIGEMGTGKTSISITSILTHANGNFNKNIFIMCPPTLVNTWKDEIERIAPLSQAVIVKSFDEMIALEPILKNKHRGYNLWVIISKESAKLGHNYRPAAVYGKSAYINRYNKNGRYICPECGQWLFTTVKKKENGRTYEEKVMFDDMSFLKKNTSNSFCMNDVRKFNHKTRQYETVKCNAPLWEAFSKDVEYHKGNMADRWYKTSKGWVLGSRREALLRGISAEQFEIESKLNDSSVYETKERNALKKRKVELAELELAIMENIEAVNAKEELELNGDLPVPVRKELSKKAYRDDAPKKIAISKYVRTHMKNDVDYFIADEVHLLKGKDSSQGEAFGDFVQVAKKTLALTGTLLNGYSTSIYYILFRLFPQYMVKEGFTHKDVNKFLTDYGVLEKKTKYTYSNTGALRKKTQVKSERAGISPVVFTNFLMENAAFITLEDIAEGLPGYKEIPVGVDMTWEMSRNYDDLKEQFKNNNNMFSNSIKYMTQMVDMLMLYPDQPYDLNPVIDPYNTNNIVMSPTAIDDKEDILPKEEALLEIAKKKAEAGEKILLYYHWTGKTDLGNRLKKLLNDNDIKAEILTTSTVSTDKRGEWLRKQAQKGTQVIICNPTLIETGLTLLDYSTIIFYQTNSRLDTMRQASRRSWRLGQTHDVEVYFLYYEDTVQEKNISIMGSKLSAAMALEGRFSEEGLAAMSANTDMLQQIASSVTENIKETVDARVFEKTSFQSRLDTAKKMEHKTLLEEALSQEETHYVLEPSSKLKAPKNDKFISKVHESPIEFIYKLIGA